MSARAGALGPLAGFLGRCQTVVGAKSGQNSGRTFCSLFVSLTFLVILPSGSLHAACKQSVCASTTDLGTLGGSNGVNSQAHGVSDSGGVVVGYSVVFDPQYSVYAPHAFMWQNGVM